MKKILLALASLATACSINAQTIKVYETIGDTTVLKYTVVNTNLRQYKVVFEETDPNYKAPEYCYDVENSFEAPAITGDQEFLEETLLKLISCIKADDFAPALAPIGGFMMANPKKLSQHATEAMENALSTVTMGCDTIADDIVKVYKYTRAEQLVQLAQLHGHLSIVDGEWVEQETTDTTNLLLDYVIKTEESKDSVALHFTHSEKGKKVFVRGMYRGKEEYNDTQDSLFVDSTDVRFFIEIPEQIMLTLSHNGDTILKVTADIDLSQFGPYWDFAKQKIASVQRVELCGYTLEQEMASSASEAGPRIALRVSKGGEQLVCLGMEFGGVYDVNYENILKSDLSSQMHNITSVKIKVNLLNWIQYDMLVKDYTHMNDMIMRYEMADDEEKQRYVERLEALYDINIRYNNKPEVRGKVKMGMMEVENKEDFTIVGETLVPYIYFKDGSSFALGDFLNKEKFAQTFEALGLLIQDLKALVRGDE